MGGHDEFPRRPPPRSRRGRASRNGGDRRPRRTRLCRKPRLSVRRPALRQLTGRRLRRPRAADTGPRRVVGASAAGESAPPPVDPGQAVRIFTGATIPRGADAVVMQEDARRDGDTVRFDESPESGAFVRRRGEEIAAGTAFDLRGRLANPPLVGLAASFGLTEVEVFRRLRVAIVGTGSELILPGTPLRGGAGLRLQPRRHRGCPPGSRDRRDHDESRRRRLRRHRRRVRSRLARRRRPRHRGRRLRRRARPRAPDPRPPRRRGAGSGAWR